MFRPILFFLLLSFSLAFTSDKPSVVNWLTETEHDFGLVQHKKPVTFSFQFRNVSEETITIDNVRTSCGCAAPDWSFEPFAPDSIGQINVRYDAKKQGYFRKRIKVYVSGQRKAEVLYVEGEVVRE
ncbi:MAG: DUF1573 domain-containing protein [Bacteroidota bacterium]